MTDFVRRVPALERLEKLVTTRVPRGLEEIVEELVALRRSRFGVVAGLH